MITLFGNPSLISIYFVLFFYSYYYITSYCYNLVTHILIFVYIMYCLPVYYLELVTCSLYINSHNIHYIIMSLCFECKSTLKDTFIKYDYGYAIDYDCLIISGILPNDYNNLTQSKYALHLLSSPYFKFICKHVYTLMI